MQERYPSYYAAFACIGGACPDSCCQGWDVVIDAETEAAYRRIPGELGAQICAAMTTDADGDRVFAMTDGHCPLWTEDGLCSVQLALGEAALCDVCRMFPRLTQDYGGFVEHGLALSCPEAARLILSSTDDSWRVTGELGDEAEYDTDLMDLLLRTREPALALIRDRRYPVGKALAMVYLYALAVQAAVDGEALCFDPEDAERVLHSVTPGIDQMPEIIRVHQRMEILTERWSARLATVDLTVAPPWEEQVRALAAYYVNRYWLQAVSDFDVLFHCRQMITACLMARWFPGVEQIALYSKEVEHDTENVDLLWEEFAANAAFQDLPLLAALLA